MPRLENTTLDDSIQVYRCMDKCDKRSTRLLLLAVKNAKTKNQKKISESMPFQFPKTHLTISNREHWS